MKFVSSIPRELEVELYNFSDWFFNQDLNLVNLREKDKRNLTANEAVSIEYLHKIQSKDHIGYPEASYGADFLEVEAVNVDKFRDQKGVLDERRFENFLRPIRELDATLKQFICSPRAAIKMFYPPEGFIAWHNNSNAYGYNILFTYSETGEGAFLYQHPITKEIVEMPDKKGWSAKVGCYDVAGGSPLWHAAYTRCHRLNWGYVIPENVWSDLMNEDFGVDISFIDDLFGTTPSFKHLKK